MNYPDWLLIRWGWGIKSGALWQAKDALGIASDGKDERNYHRAVGKARAETLTERHSGPFVTPPITFA